MRVERSAGVDRAPLAWDPVARIIVLKEKPRIVVGTDLEDKAMTPLEDGAGRQDFDSTATGSKGATFLISS